MNISVEGTRGFNFPFGIFYYVVNHTPVGFDEPHFELGLLWFVELKNRSRIFPNNSAWFCILDRKQNDKGEVGMRVEKNKEICVNKFSI